jgi:hypothetical protein
MTETRRVGVVLERRRSSSPWVDFVWRPVAVLAGVPDVGIWESLGEVAGAERYFAGMSELAFHRSDTATYRDNLATGAPQVWVRCRMQDGRPEVVGVTADPAEGEGFTEAGDDLVDQVPMPPEVAAALAGFVAAHHVERVFLKRRRDRGFEEEE